MVAWGWLFSRDCGGTGLKRRSVSCGIFEVVKKNSLYQLALTNSGCFPLSRIGFVLVSLSLFPFGFIIINSLSVVPLLAPHFQTFFIVSALILIFSISFQMLSGKCEKADILITKTWPIKPRASSWLIVEDQIMLPPSDDTAASVSLLSLIF